MAINFFGFSVSRNKTQPEASTGPIKSFTPPEADDGAAVIEAGGLYGQYVDLDGTIKNDIDMIIKYRSMILHHEVDAAVADIVNEAVITTESKPPVQLVLDDVELSDNIKETMTEEFDKILHLLDFNRRGDEIFRKWYIDSRLYYHTIIDENHPKKGIQELRPIDPTKIRKVKEIKKDKMSLKGPGGASGETSLITGHSEYYIFNDKGNPYEGFGTNLKIYPDSIIYTHSGLYDYPNKRIVGYLHKAIKPLNQLRMIEDSVVIYRIARAPERRIFYIDVGSLPKMKAEQYLRDIMNRYRNKLVYNANTGEIADDANHMSMLEDFWLPRREGGKGTEISTLDGGQNLGEMEDVEYFQKKLYRALDVPSTRLEADNGFNMGRASEISRDELKFSKFIDRLRNRFSQLFIETLRTQLLLKGVMKEDDFTAIRQNIQFKYLKDSYFAESKETEILRDRFDILETASEYIGKYYSLEFVRKNLLRQTDEEVKEMDKQIAREREEGMYNDAASEMY